MFFAFSRELRTPKIEQSQGLNSAEDNGNFKGIGDETEDALNLKATLFAWKNGFPIVEQVGVWRGYGVFEPKYANEGEQNQPTVILANDSEARFATSDEAFACLSCVAS